VNLLACSTRRSGSAPTTTSWSRLSRSGFPWRRPNAKGDGSRRPLSW